MALPAANDLKTYLRILTTAEDTLLASLMTRAQAQVEGFLQRPIIAAAVTDTICLEEAGTTLILPRWPVETDTVTLTDPDGDAVADTDYTVALNGVITAADDVTFALGEWTAAYTQGWSAHPRYDDLYEPLIGAAILDMAADLYERRNPAIAQDASGGGVSRTWKGGVAERIRDTLRPMLRMEAW